MKSHHFRGLKLFQVSSLTTGLDTGSSFTGGSTADTFTAQETGTATTDTLTTGDNLKGGAGTDTLSIAVSGTPAGATTAGVVTSDIEALSVYNNSTAAYDVDATLMAGITDIYVNGGSFGTTVSNVDTLANLHLISTSKAATVTATATAVVGSADEAIILSNGTAQTADVTATYNGLEVINFVAAGTTGLKSATVDNSLTLASTDLEKVVVTGDAAANITVSLAGAALETQTAEFDASGAGGVITAHVTKGASENATVTMSAQNDYLDFNGALASTITLDGGDGVDYLELDTDVAYSATATAQSASGVSNFEALRLASGVDVDERSLVNNAGITSLIAVAGGSYTKSTALASITQLSDGTFTTSAATDGSTDALTMNLIGAGVASTLSAANVETLTVTSGGAAANSLTMSAAGSADLTSITASGTKGLTLTISGTSLATVDASGITGVGNAFALVASASDADMTVTASAVRPTNSETGTANTITTGDGDDTVTGGDYKDVITTNDGDDTVTSGDGDDTVTTGRGDDTITVGNGDTTIDAGIGDDTITAGNGDNTITLGSGDDTVTAGNGDNTIVSTSGDDTITTGSGDDVVVLTDYDDDDVISLGTGSNVLLRSALATTGAYPVVGNYVAVSGDIEPQFTDADISLISHTAAASNVSAATGETIDLSSSSGFSAMYLNFVTAANTTNYTVTNFDGAVLNLAALAVDAPRVLNVDGTGQSALTIKTNTFTNAGAAPTLVVTQADALTVDTEETVTVSGVTTAVTNTVLGAITADGSESVTIKTDAVANTITGVTLTTAAVSADGASALAINAGGNTDLVVGAVTSTGTDVDTLAITAGDDANLNLTSVTATGSELSSLTVTAGIGATIGADLTGTTVLPITATSVEAATITLGAASTSAFDLAYAGTTAIAMTTGSTLLLGNVGVAAKVSSTTVTGRGDLNNGAITLLGDASFDFSGFTQSAGVLTITASSAGDKTITTNDGQNSLTVNGTGDNTITTGAANDSVTTGAGDDTITGGAGDDTLNGAGGDDTLNGGIGTDGLNGGTGDDSLNGGAGVDTLTGGTGADSLSGGTGLDKFVFAAGDAAVTIAGTGNAGTITGYDSITDFALGTATSLAEQLEYGTESVAAAGAVNGTDSTLTIGGVAVKSHSVAATGIVTFDDADTFASALVIDSLADVAAVVQYLQLQDLGASDGITVAFNATISDVAHTFVFTQGVDAGTDASDSLVDLVGVTGTSISATNATTAGLIDIGV